MSLEELEKRVAELEKVVERLMFIIAINKSKVMESNKLPF